MTENYKFPAMKSKLVLPEQSYEQRLCRHRQLELHPDIRLLLCETCKLWIDPFDFLVEYSGEELILSKQLKAMRKERKELADQIPELKRQRQNIKAQIRNAKRKIQEQG